MLTDPYLRDVVKESGRGEIIIGMVVEAERRYLKALVSYLPAWSGEQQCQRDALAAQTSAAQAQQNCFGYGGLDNILGSFGAALGYSSQCPTCGR